MQIIRTTSPDPLANAAGRLERIYEGTATQTDERTWRVSGVHPERSIVIHVIDGEWNCGVDITILNRVGVIMAEAAIHMIGMSPSFVANIAGDLNDEIR